MPKKLTQDEFIKKSKDLFEDKLDYSKVNYVNGREKIILTCKLHGDFSICPKDHLCYKNILSIFIFLSPKQETYQSI